MDYGNILTRSWNIIWVHKYLILLGVLAALGSGGGGFGTGGASDFGGESADNGFQFEGAPLDFGQIGSPAELTAVAAILVLVCVGLLIGLAVWAVSRVAAGGLIAGASTIDGGSRSSFGQDWRAGWSRVWRLIGIGLIPLIPVLILLVLGIVLGGMFYSFSSVSNEFAVAPARSGLGIALVVVACIFIPIAVALNLLRTFADRACVLENLSVLNSYGRGWQVLSANLGPALILFVIQIAITVVLGIGLLLPSLLILLCCFLWPLLLLVQGAVTSYFSTMWTLAWREWTGMGHGGEIAADAAQAG